MGDTRWSHHSCTPDACLTWFGRSVGIYCSIYGSVLPRALPWAVLGAAEGAVLEWASQRYKFFDQFQNSDSGGAWYHPYAFHVFGMMLGFALVMRIQIAYQRYWEGTSTCHTAAARWADAVMQVMAFDEASKDAFSEEGLEFRMLILHYASLMHACALIDIRRDDDLGCALSLNREDPYLFRPNANPALVDGGRVARSDSAVGMAGDFEAAAQNGRSFKAGSHRSHRAHTTPMQMVLQTRRSLMSQLETDINSFEAIEAESGRRASPLSYAPTTADKGCRQRARAASASAATFSGDGACFSGRGAKDGVRTGTTEASDVSRSKLCRGSLSRTDFAAASILLKKSPALLQRLARANGFDVVGGVTDGELELLERLAPGDRAYVVQTWIVRLMTNRLSAGGLAIPPPLLSRTYQVLSDGTAAAMHARKVSYVAFPFPLRQLLVLLLLVFNIFAPMCIAAFMATEWLVATLSFFVCLGYQSLNETAAELEHPFGLGANHLQLTAYQRQFNSKLAHLFDQTIPQLGYIPKGGKPAALSNARVTPPAPDMLGKLGASGRSVGAVGAVSSTSNADSAAPGPEESSPQLPPRRLAAQGKPSP